MRETPSLSLVLACYNEEEIFSQSIEEITRALDRSRLSYEMIFVDDTSTDRTPTLIMAFCKRHPFARAIVHARNTGRGRAVADGLRLARGRVAGYIDIDCEVSPVYIGEMVEAILTRKADVVIGRRIYRTSVSSIVREILSIGYRQLANWLLHTDKLDTETGYKFFHRKKILPIVEKTRHPHWFWDTEVIVRAKRKGLRIIELPVLFVRRTDKRSSVRIVSDSWDYLINLWRLRNTLRI